MDGIEAVVLNGGASSRMGRDKASLTIHGIAMAERIVSALVGAGYPVNVLGRPVAGASSLPDPESFAGPLAALGGYEPSHPHVFVCSCDLPEFNVRIVKLLAESIGQQQAAVPWVEGRAQPLCALYSASAWPILRAVLHEGKRSMMAWLDVLSYRRVCEDELVRSGIDPASVLGVNTPEEFRSRVGATDIP